VADARREFSSPEALTAQHQTAVFDSGEPALDDWLRDRALDNLAAGASRTYAACPSGSMEVAAYYAVAMGSIAGEDVPGSMRRNMPKLIPSVVLGRLAVDRKWQGFGLGAVLLRDAVMRSVRAAGEISARLVVVHAISPAAEAFYLHHGFTRLPVETPTLALDLVKLARLGTL
jgi:GNAT superfamily N-acetyltransferase